MNQPTKQVIDLNKAVQLSLRVVTGIPIREIEAALDSHEEVVLDAASSPPDYDVTYMALQRIRETNRELIDVIVMCRDPARGTEASGHVYFYSDGQTEIEPKINVSG